MWEICVTDKTGYKVMTSRKNLFRYAQEVSTEGQISTSALA